MANEQVFRQSLIITGSVTSSVGFSGDGSGLTGITAVAEWDGSRNGDASITGSLVVSGSGVNVDFTNTTGVSGSFSGSFFGDGSGLTGVGSSPSIFDRGVIYADGGSGSFFLLSGSQIITGSQYIKSVGREADIDFNVIADSSVTTSRTGANLLPFGNSGGTNSVNNLIIGYSNQVTGSNAGYGYNSLIGFWNQVGSFAYAHVFGIHNKIGLGYANGYDGGFADLAVGHYNRIIVDNQSSYLVAVGVGNTVQQEFGGTHAFGSGLDVRSRRATVVGVGNVAQAFTSAAQRPRFTVGIGDFILDTTPPSIYPSGTRRDGLNIYDDGLVVANESSISVINNAPSHAFAPIPGRALVTKEWVESLGLVSGSTQITGSFTGSFKGSFIGADSIYTADGTIPAAVDRVVSLGSDDSTLTITTGSADGLFLYVSNNQMVMDFTGDEFGIATTDGDGINSSAGGTTEIAGSYGLQIRPGTGGSITTSVAGQALIATDGNGSTVWGDYDFADLANLPTLISSSLQFSNSTSPFTGSFTGSFVGDGSGLTGLTADSDWYSGGTYVSSSVEIRVTGAISGSSKLTIGSNQTNTGTLATIAGGANSIASGNCSTIGGGLNNNASGSFSSIGGGVDNVVLGPCATIAGGSDNEAYGSCSFVGGGFNNCACGNESIVVGGAYQNITPAGVGSFIGGGSNHCIVGTVSVIVGGDLNCVSSGTYNSIVGGCSHNIIGSYNSIGGGENHNMTANHSTIGGGFENSAGSNALKATIGGGCGNTAFGDGSTVGGGFGNTAYTDYTSIGGGLNNTACGLYSGILGGNSNIIPLAHSNSFVVGSNITTTRECTTYVNNLFVTGSTTADSILQLTPRTTTPGSPEEGMIISSGSHGASVLYYYDGSTWNALF